MTASGTTAFAPDLVEIIEEAHELAGVEMRTGYQLRSARRSLDLLMLEWANRDYNLWLVDSATVSLTASTATKTLATDCIDVIEGNIVISNVEYRVRRISAKDYMHQVNKTSTGRPTIMWVDRQLAAPVATFWPTPDQAYSFKYWYLRRVEDSGGSTYTPDVPFRFMPALIAGLAHKIAAKTPESASRVPFLEAEAEKQWLLAADEDRERVGFRIRPRIR